MGTINDAELLKPPPYPEEPSLETLVFTALGAASTCWIPGTGDAEFDEARAQAIGYRLIKVLRQRGIK